MKNNLIVEWVWRFQQSYEKSDADYLCCVEASNWRDALKAARELAQIFCPFYHRDMYISLVCIRPLNDD